MIRWMRMTSHDYKVWSLVVFIVVLFGINLTWNQITAGRVQRAESAAIAQAIRQDDHKWCMTLDILTKHPAPRPANPSQNPSREDLYLLYVSLVQVRAANGC